MAYYPDFPTVDDAGQGFGFTPQQMMLLGLSQGLLQAGSPSARPVGIGGALGSGMCRLWVRRERRGMRRPNGLHGDNRRVRRRVPIRLGRRGLGPWRAHL